MVESVSKATVVRQWGRSQRHIDEETRVTSCLPRSLTSSRPWTGCTGCSSPRRPVRAGTLRSRGGFPAPPGRCTRWLCPICTEPTVKHGYINNILYAVHWTESQLHGLGVRVTVTWSGCESHSYLVWMWESQLPGLDVRVTVTWSGCESHSYLVWMWVNITWFGCESMLPGLGVRVSYLVWMWVNVTWSGCESHS